MADADAGPEAITWLAWPYAGRDLALALALTRFTPAGFQHGRFAAAGIVCPPQIVASALKRQAEFFYGRLCARAALRRMGVAADALQLPIGCRREPLWPAGVIGSITHTPAVAAAIALPATGKWRGVGIDIEAILSADAAAAARSVVVSSAETHYLTPFEAGLGAHVPLTLVFSAKESFFKAVHGVVGRYFNFDAVQLIRIDLASQTLILQLRETLCAQWRAGMRCAVAFRFLDDSHVATLCLWGDTSEQNGD
jgi:4'-phosphopantetheinyl transferase EntD